MVKSGKRFKIGYNLCCLPIMMQFLHPCLHVHNLNICPLPSQDTIKETETTVHVVSILVQYLLHLSVASVSFNRTVPDIHHIYLTYT